MLGERKSGGNRIQGVRDEAVTTESLAVLGRALRCGAEVPLVEKSRFHQEDEFYMRRFASDSPINSASALSMRDSTRWWRLSLVPGLTRGRWCEESLTTSMDRAGPASCGRFGVELLQG